MKLQPLVLIFGCLVNLVFADTDSADLDCSTTVCCTKISTTTTTTTTTETPPADTTVTETTTTTTTETPPPETTHTTTSTITTTATMTTEGPSVTVTTTQTEATTTTATTGSCPPCPNISCPPEKPPVTSTVTHTPESCQPSAQPTPSSVCTHIVADWKPIRLDWSSTLEQYQKPRQPEPQVIVTGYEYPTIFELVDDKLKLEQYDVSIDGRVIGRTSDVLQGKKQHRCEVAEECIKNGFSYGKFEVPAGQHLIGISWPLAEQEDISNWDFGSGQYRFLRVTPCNH